MLLFVFVVVCVLVGVVVGVVVCVCRSNRMCGRLCLVL